MKKIKILLILFLFASCSKNSIEECDCVKNTYEVQSILISAPNTTPMLNVEHVLVSSEGVECQEEQEGVSIDGNKYYNIECD